MCVFCRFRVSEFAWNLLGMNQVIELAKNVAKNQVVRTAALIIVPTVVSIVAYRKYKRAQRRKTYPKDVVILHQYPNGFRAPSPSPWSLKLETWLRMTKIPYQVIHTFIILRIFNFTSIPSIGQL